MTTQTIIRCACPVTFEELVAELRSRDVRVLRFADGKIRLNSLTSKHQPRTALTISEAFCEGVAIADLRDGTTTKVVHPLGAELLVPVYRW